MDIQVVFNAVLNFLNLVLMTVLPILVVAGIFAAYEFWKKQKVEAKGTKEEQLLDMVEYVASVVVTAMKSEDMQNFTEAVEEKLVTEAQEILDSRGVSEIHVKEIVAAIREKVAEAFDDTDEGESL